MSKRGRNAPCHCGSGKKYKACCLRKDEELEVEKIIPSDNEPDHEHYEEEEYDEYGNDGYDEEEYDSSEQQEQEILDLLGLGDGDEYDEEMEAFWEEYEEMSYDKKVELFREKVSDSEWMDEEDMAFDMLNCIYVQMVKEKKSENFLELLSYFQEKHPHIYAEVEIYYIHWAIDIAIHQRDWEKVSSLVKEVLNHVEEEFDVWERLVDQIKYHVPTSILLKILQELQAKVEQIKKQDKEEGIEEDYLANRGVILNHDIVETMIFEFIESSDKKKDKKELWAKTYDYLEWEEEAFFENLSRFTNKSDKKWTLDYILTNKEEFSPSQREMEYQKRVRYFSVLFLKYLYQEKGISYPKGNLACFHLCEYVYAHQELYKKVQAKQKKKGKNKKKQPSQQTIDNILCPDEQTLNPFMTEIFGLLGEGTYATITLFECLPAWLEFLERHNLIDEKRRKETYESLKEMKESILELVSCSMDSEEIEERIEKAWR